MKTKLGISVGLMGALLYLLGLVSGDLVLVLLVGYVLLREDNTWLKATAVKALVIGLGFSVLTLLINFIPNLINMINDLLMAFGSSFRVAVVSNLVNFLLDIILILKKVLLLVLGAMALKQNTIKLGFIDNFVNTHLNPAPKAVAPKFCTKCGQKIPGDAVVCPHCGNQA